jgi:hypothetical protein
MAHTENGLIWDGKQNARTGTDGKTTDRKTRNKMARWCV